MLVRIAHDCMHTDTVLKLLVLDPEKRIPLNEVQQHPWIIKHCVKGERAAMRCSGGKEAKAAQSIQPVQSS